MDPTTQVQTLDEAGYIPCSANRQLFNIDVVTDLEKKPSEFRYVWGVPVT